MQKGISFIDNCGIKEFHLGKRKLHLTRKVTVPLQNIYCITLTGQIDFFSL